MHFLTHQEKTVLLGLVFVVLTGSAVRYAFGQFPSLGGMIHFMEAGPSLPKLDLNKASEEELIELPYIGVYTARRIIEFRETRGPFKDIQQLKTIKGIKEKNFAMFSKYLKISRE